MLVTLRRKEVCRENRDASYLEKKGGVWIGHGC